MLPGTRACYGASTVGIFSGLMMAAAGAIIILETTYKDGQVAHVIWMLVSFMCVTGFGILLLSLLFCSCAFCMQASADVSVYPGDDDEEMGKKPNGWASPPMPIPNGHTPWTDNEGKENGWGMPESPVKPESPESSGSPDAAELEDLDAIVDELQEAELLAEELAKDEAEEQDPPPVETEEAPVEEPEEDPAPVDSEEAPAEEPGDPEVLVVEDGGDGENGKS